MLILIVFEPLCCQEFNTEAQLSIRINDPVTEKSTTVSERIQRSCRWRILCKFWRKTGDGEISQSVYDSETGCSRRLYEKEILDLVDVGFVLRHLLLAKWTADPTGFSYHRPFPLQERKLSC